MVQYGSSALPSSKGKLGGISCWLRWQAVVVHQQGDIIICFKLSLPTECPTSPVTHWSDLKPDLTSQGHVKLQVCLNCGTKVPKKPCSPVAPQAHMGIM